MPPEDLINPFIVNCQGGLILDTGVLAMPPGACSELQNYEPDINGGYRRLDGYSKYSATELSGAGNVLGVAILGSNVIGARGANLQKGTGTTWTSIVTNRTSAGRYHFRKYNWTGSETLLGADGVNYPFTYDNSTYTLLNGAVGSGFGTAPIAPDVVVEHKGRTVSGGYTNLGGSGAILITPQFTPNEFRASEGALEIKLGDTFVNAISFREELYIFCERRIYKLVGSSPSDFQVKPVANSIGCIASHSVQELAGDIIYLAPDGLRTVSGTAKIGDVALDNISKGIQPRLRNLTTAQISSVTVDSKTQYRLFFPTTAVDTANAKGVVGTLRRNTETGQPGWEWADLKGINPNVCWSDRIGDDEYILHGANGSGFVFRQDNGNTFNGTNIVAKFRSPDYNMGDPGLRKILQRINLNYEADGAINVQLYARLNYEDININQPGAKNITQGSNSAVYGTAQYGTGIYGLSNVPLKRQHLEGSGFAIAVEINDTSSNPSHTIRGFSIESVPGGRR